MALHHQPLNRATTCITLSLLLGTTQLSVAEQSEQHSFTGRYTIAEGYQGNAALDQDGLRNIRVAIAKNVITTLDVEGNNLYVASYTLDNDAEPWRITMTAKVTPVGGGGAQSQGLVSSRDGIVKLAYSLPGGEAPDDFQLEPGQQMFVLQRESDI